VKLSAIMLAIALWIAALVCGVLALAILLLTSYPRK